MVAKHVVWKYAGQWLHVAGKVFDVFYDVTNGVSIGLHRVEVAHMRAYNGFRGKLKKIPATFQQRGKVARTHEAARMPLTSKALHSCNQPILNAGVEPFVASKVLQLMSEEIDLKQRVVVIDDEQGFRLLLSDILEELDYEVYTIAQATPESLSIIKFSDIVFLDIRMPGLSGTDVIKLMAHDGVKCSLVLMSGIPTAVTEAEELAHELGVELLGVLVKPFRIADVSALLE